MKCFERLVWTHIISNFPPRLDHHQFAYRANRSDDDISTTLHLVLSHLEWQWSYVQLLFVGFSSAFNIVLPNRLVAQLSDLGKSHSSYLWIKDFLANHDQRVQLLVSAPALPRAAC